jgi:hypothetical protein
MDWASDVVGNRSMDILADARAVLPAGWLDVPFDNGSRCNSRYAAPLAASVLISAVCAASAARGLMRGPRSRFVANAESRHANAKIL